jgi:hypothetical protein
MSLKESVECASGAIWLLITFHTASAIQDYESQQKEVTE